MAIAQIPVASSGLSASDLITQPSYTLIGSYFNSTFVSSININLTNPSLYRSLHVEFHDINSTENQFLYMRLNDTSSSATYRSASQGFYMSGGYASVLTGREENTSFRLTGINNTFQNKQGWIDIYNINSTERKLIKGRIGYTHNSYPYNFEDFHGDANISSSITSIQFLAAVGNVATGNSTTRGILVFGVK